MKYPIVVVSISLILIVFSSCQFLSAPNTTQAAREKANNVHLMTDDGSFYASGRKDPQLEELEYSLEEIGPLGLLKTAPREDLRMEEVKLIAWCDKTRPDLPLPKLNEEIVVLVHWSTGEREEFTLYFLRSNDVRAREVVWVLAARRVNFIDNFRSFEKMPTTGNILTFILQTNFGNRYFMDRILVGNVLTTIDKKSFQDALNFSLTDEKRTELRNRFISSISRK